MAFSTEQYRMLVEHSPAMLWRAGPDLSVDYVNETWLDFTGRSLERELGHGWTESIHPDDLDRYRQLASTFLAAQRPFDVVFRLRRHDGVYRWISKRAVPFTGEQGQFAGFVATCVDVDDARRADETKTTFLAMLAHELRTPLTPMAGYIHQMERRIGRGEPVFIEMVQKLGRQMERIEALVEHLSDAARVNAGKAVGIAIDQVDLTKIVRDIVDKHGTTNEVTRRTELVLVGDEQAQRIIHADEKRLRQLLRHLITNAIKFSPRGGRIEVRLESSPFQHCVSVHDMGIGIPEGDLHEVTKAYYRAANASPENYPGIGLGLAIAREIAEAHGGSLELESALGKGTQVTVRLPAASAAA